MAIFFQKQTLIIIRFLEFEARTMGSVAQWTERRTRHWLVVNSSPIVSHDVFLRKTLYTDR